MRRTYVLEIEWHNGVDLPKLVGPFQAQGEAEQWARQNIPNGTFEIHPLTPPYYTKGDTR